jgi:predicted Zn-dependent protease with MMP-like domain
MPVDLRRGARYNVNNLDPRECMETPESESAVTRRGLRYDTESFEALVVEALDGLPEEIHAWLDNVAIVVADHPTPAHLRQGRVRRGGLLLGLYVGVPKTRRGITYGEVLPDKIVIFQRPIEMVCRTAEEIREQVRRTVLHEIGHHFGMDEGDLREAGV